MKFFLTAAALFMGIATTASAATYTLDFDGPGFDSTNSQTVSNPATFTDDGITWEIATSGGRGAAIFDTTCFGYGGSDGCNGDADLRPLSGTGDVSGNILIQQRNSNPTPNDDANTDWITLTLKSDVQLIWTSVSAVDDGGYIFSTNKDGEVGSIAIVGESEQGKTSFQSSVLTMGDVITIDFRGVTKPGGVIKSQSSDGTDSGGVDSFNFTVVPLPAGLPLLIGGLGALAWIKRRKNRV